MSIGVDSGALSIDDMVRALRDVEQDSAVSNHIKPVSPIQNVAGAQPFEAVAYKLSAAEAAQKLKEESSVRKYAVAFALASTLGLAGLVYGNKSFAPEMYATGGMAPAAAAQAQGLNYKVFDLNLNVRAWRDEQLARMTKTPELVIIGASHWQEAHKDLLKGVDFYNAHIHRDYWEDLPGMVELLVRNDRLPKKLIVAIRDKQFTPVDSRKDWLWEPGIAAYREATKRLGIESSSWWKTAPWHRAQALISLPMFFENFTRWHHAPEYPGPTSLNRSETMDMILPDGSIMWSNRKLTQVLTQERMHNEVNNFSKVALNSPLEIDPKGVEAWDATFKFLKSQGVQVYLTNPPFNPEFYDRTEGTAYGEGLSKIEALTKRFSKDYGFPIFGGFNPHEAGCTADQYIDAEHSNPACLQNIFDQFLALDKQMSAK